MKIAINCWVLRNKEIDGIGRFTIETARLMIQSHPESSFMILCDKNFTEDFFDFPNVTKHHIFPSFRHPILYVFYMETVVKKFLKNYLPDIFFSPDGQLSLRSNCRQLPVIHDLYFEHNPKDLNFKNRIYYRTFFKRFAKKATRIVTISYFSKKDISSLYSVNETKIDVVHLAGSDIFKPISLDLLNEIKCKYTDGKDYFFFVGSMHPRKNIKRLMEAFNLFKKRTGSDKKLLLVGNILWKGNELAEEFKNLEFKQDIIFAGRLADEELWKVAGSAFCLAFVSLFEGFGLPIVEAFSSGVPVICSNVSSMPEVGGDAVLLVDPYDTENISRAMEKLHFDESFRQSLIKKGFERKELFSWEETSNLLYRSITRAVNS